MANVGLVVANTGSLTAGDLVLQARLVAAGHTVVLRDDGAAENVTGIEGGVMVSDSCVGNTFNSGNKYDTAAIPGIALEATNWRLGTFNQGGSGTGWNVASVPPLNGGLTGTPLTVYGSAQSAVGCTFSGLGAGAQVVARDPASTTRCIYFVYEAGAALVGGGAAPARRACFRVLDAAVAALNSNGLALLDSAIAWAFGVEGEEPISTRQLFLGVT